MRQHHCTYPGASMPLTTVGTPEPEAHSHVQVSWSKENKDLYFSVSPCETGLAPPPRAREMSHIRVQCQPDQTWHMCTARRAGATRGRADQDAIVPSWQEVRTFSILTADGSVVFILKPYSGTTWTAACRSWRADYKTKHVVLIFGEALYVT